MSSLVVTLFGAPQIELDGRPVHVDRQKALALLAYLAVSEDPHRRDLPAALLWPELDQQHARASLRRALSSLHIALQRRWLAITNSTVALPAQDGLWIDVLQFRSLQAAYQENKGAGDLSLLNQAAALYKGDFLSGFSLPDSPEFDDWQRAVTEDLRRDLARILDWLGAGYAALGDYPSAIQHVRRWVRLDPLNEPAQVQLMQLYAESGQLEAAHSQYKHFSQLLFQEIGALPESTTTELYSTLTRRKAVAPRAIAEAPPDALGLSLPQHRTRSPVLESSTVKGVSSPEDGSTLHLSIKLLGGFTLLAGGRLVAIPGTRLQALLAYLLLNRKRPQPRQHLAFLFWPDTDEVQALSNLRNLLYKLRHALPESDRFIKADAHSVQWLADAPFSFDVAHFETVATRTASLSALEEAAALYQGALLPGCYDDWIQPERSRLHQIATAAYEQLLDLLEAQGEYARAIAHAQRLLHLDPLAESTYRRLMQFHALKGNYAAALSTYHACETTLQRELCAQPGPVTQALYERLWSAEAPPPPKPATPQALPLVGRQDEWRLLQRAWRNATNGKAQVVVLAGEAGIGKTRLAEELVMWAARLGFSTATAHCYAAEGTLAYAPMVEWLRSKPISQALPALDAIWLVEIARLLPELLVSHPHLPHPTLLIEGWQRQRFFEAMARALLHRRRPILLFIDDLHWCDPEMLEWLHFLMRFDPTAPLLLLTAIRSEEVSATHPVMPLLAALDRDSQLTEIVLGRLNADATAEVAAVVAGRPLSREQAAQLYQETEGSPLFIVEMVRSQASEAAIEALPVEDTAADPILFRKTRYLPPRVHHIIHTRLNQLSSGARDLSCLAATIGREFTSAVLAMASELDDDELVRYLDELWQRRILREKGADGYDFSHDKLREVAYMTLSAARRRLLHRRVARALETVQAGEMRNSRPVLDQTSGQIASHYEQAGDLAEAIRYYQQAADVARRLYANSDAIHYYRRALALIEDGADHGQAKILALYENFSDLLLLTGRPEEAIAMCTRPLAQAQGVDRARLLRKIGSSLCQQHNYAEALAAYADARRTLEESRPAPSSTAPDAEERARWYEWIQIQLDINMIHYWLGQVEESADLLQRLQPAVEAWGDQSQRANFFRHRALMTFMRNRTIAQDETIADSRSCLALHLAAGDESAIPLDHFMLGFFILWHGEPAAAHQEIQIALDLARQRGDITLEARCLTYLTIATRQLGEVDAANDYVAQSLDVAVRAKMPEYIALARANESWIAWRAGDWQRARQSGCVALTLWKEVDSSHTRHPFKWTALWPLIAVAVNENALHTALEYLHILTSADQQPIPETLCPLIDQIVLSWEQGKIECTRRHLEEALALAQDLHYL